MSKTVVPVLIVGPSGSGKSSTFRNLDPKKTVIVNTERKPLPFQEFNKFKNVNISKYKDFVQLMSELSKKTEYEIVVIDSFTSLTEIIEKYCNSVYSGFEQWKQYNEAIQNALWSIKDLPQQVFITGIPEYTETSPGEQKGYIRVKGKEHKYGGTEKEFAIVLWTKMIEDEEGEIEDFQLSYKPSKRNTAKAPNGMFEGELPNDARIVMEAIDKFYGNKTTTTS